MPEGFARPSSSPCLLPLFLLALSRLVSGCRAAADSPRFFSLFSHAVRPSVFSRRPHSQTHKLPTTLSRDSSKRSMTTMARRAGRGGGGGDGAGGRETTRTTDVAPFFSSSPAALGEWGFLYATSRPAQPPPEAALQFRDPPAGGPHYAAALQVCRNAWRSSGDEQRARRRRRSPSRASTRTPSKPTTQPPSPLDRPPHKTHNPPHRPST